MKPKFVSPEATKRLLELAQSSYRPKAIVDLKEEIEGEIRAAELAQSMTGIVDEERIRRIVAMKLRLDGLYTDWAEGKIE
jgi:hypothetical protein